MALPFHIGTRIRAGVTRIDAGLARLRPGVPGSPFLVLAVIALQETVKSLDDTATTLSNAARERLDLVAQHNTTFENARKAHAFAVNIIGSEVDAAKGNINAILAKPDADHMEALKAMRVID